MTTRRAIAAVLCAMVLAAPSGGLAACLSRGDGRSLMEKGQVIPLPEALQRAGLSPGELVDVQLCQGGGGYVYKVRILQDGGKLRTMNIPAR